MKLINIHGEKYRYLKDRIRNSIKIYKSTDNNFFARVGTKKDIDLEYHYHLHFCKNNFLVPLLVSKGVVIDNSHFYLEKSIGEIHYGQMFSEEFKNKQCISGRLFSKFIIVINEYYHSQYMTIDKTEIEKFKDRINIDRLIQKFPALRSKLLAFWELAKRKIEDGLPFVLSHGDFQAYNIFDNGVIDFEASLYAPLGYDAVKCIYGAFFFPKNGNYEETRSYQFSKNQIFTLTNKYLKACNDKNLQDPFRYKEELIIFNTIWATSDMYKYPKLENWRIHLLNDLLDLYLDGNKSEIMNYLLSN